MTCVPWAVVAGSVVAAAVVSAAFEMPVAVIWNASASAPVGLYAIRAAATLEVGDLVVVSPPASLARLLELRGYLPSGVPMLKRIAGLPRQPVCRFGHIVTVDGKTVGRARDRDREGRLLPSWQGCHRIGSQQIFLMNVGVEDSLDGRYFAVLPRGSVIGRALPLFVDEDADGDFEWRASAPACSPR